MNYRGYLICKGLYPGHYWIEKGGHFIGYAESQEQAKSIIDALLD